MTHFIGAVLVPATVTNHMNTYPTKYPDLYGVGAQEWVPGTELDDYLNEALERFNENREVSIWQPKSQLIAKARKNIEDYRDGTYANFIKDPEAYKARYATANPRHFQYLEEEFAQKLTWTDEEIYKNEVIKFVSPENIRESDGAVHTTYNPDSKWDWWTIGGRWEETYRSRQCEKVGALREELQKALVNMKDPEAQAELAEVEAEVKRVRDAFMAQSEARRAIATAEEAGQHAIAGALSVSTEVEKPLTWEDVDKAEAKRIECRAYMPWWFPYSLVTKDAELSEDEETHQLTGYEWHTAGRMGWFGMKSDDMTQVEWVEKLIEILADRDENDFLVYIDFHI